MNDNIELDYGNADGIFKRAMAYQKVLAHQTSILSEKEYQKFILERLEKDNDYIIRDAKKFDRYFAMDREMLFKFLNDTQAETICHRETVLVLPDYGSWCISIPCCVDKRQPGHTDCG